MVIPFDSEWTAKISSRTKLDTKKVGKIVINLTQTESLYEMCHLNLFRHRPEMFWLHHSNDCYVHCAIRLIEQHIKGNGASYNIIFNKPSHHSIAQPKPMPSYKCTNKYAHNLYFASLRSVFRQCTNVCGNTKPRVLLSLSHGCCSCFVVDCFAGAHQMLLVDKWVCYFCLGCCFWIFFSISLNVKW